MDQVVIGKELSLSILGIETVMKVDKDPPS
jgi:hypothetical protein